MSTLWEGVGYAAAYVVFTAALAAILLLTHKVSVPQIWIAPAITAAIAVIGGLIQRWLR